MEELEEIADIDSEQQHPLSRLKLKNLNNFKKDGHPIEMENIQKSNSTVIRAGTIVKP